MSKTFCDRLLMWPILTALETPSAPEDRNVQDFGYQVLVHQKRAVSGFLIIGGYQVSKLSNSPAALAPLDI